jgi:hypothetical protein
MAISANCIVLIVNAQRPPADQEQEQEQDVELSLEDTGDVQARIGVPPDDKAAYVRQADKSSDKPKQTGDLRALSKWIAKHREIAELNGEPVSVRTRKER